MRRTVASRNLFDRHSGQLLLQKFAVSGAAFLGNSASLNCGHVDACLGVGFR
jgi:hypothetical protein